MADDDEWINRTCFHGIRACCGAGQDGSEPILDVPHEICVKCLGENTLYGLDEDATIADLTLISQAWSPWASVILPTCGYV